MSSYHDRYKQPDSPKLKMGDRVLVMIQPGYRQPHIPVLAEVTKAGRVWLDLRAVEHTPGSENHYGGPHFREWHLRRDTQNEGMDSRYGNEFRTPEQHEWHQALAAAQAVLKAHGIEIHRRHAGEKTGRWDSAEGVLRLAALLEADNPSLPVRVPGEALAAVQQVHPVLLDHHANHAF